jgi:hypothetical protein
MARESVIKKILSGNWLLVESVNKNYKVFLMIIAAFVLMLFQQYRVEALYIKSVKYKQQLRIAQTEYVYSSVELMNTTLESVIAKRVKQHELNLELPEKLPVVIKMPAEPIKE